MKKMPKIKMTKKRRKVADAHGEEMKKKQQIITNFCEVMLFLLVFINSVVVLSEILAILMFVVDTYLFDKILIQLLYPVLSSFEMIRKKKKTLYCKYLR